MPASTWTPSHLRFFSLDEGKGPEKEQYEEKIRRLRLKRVAFRTMWLSAEDYPLLLGRLCIFNLFIISLRISPLQTRNKMLWRFLFLFTVLYFSIAY